MGSWNVASFVLISLWYVEHIPNTSHSVTALRTGPNVTTSSLADSSISVGQSLWQDRCCPMLTHFDMTHVGRLTDKLSCSTMNQKQSTQHWWLQPAPLSTAATVKLISKLCMLYIATYTPRADVQNCQLSLSIHDCLIAQTKVSARDTLPKARFLMMLLKHKQG